MIICKPVIKIRRGLHGLQIKAAKGDSFGLYGTDRKSVV